MEHSNQYASMPHLHVQPLSIFLLLYSGVECVVCHTVNVRHDHLGGVVDNATIYQHGHDTARKNGITLEFILLTKLAYLHVASSDSI